MASYSKRVSIYKLHEAMMIALDCSDGSYNWLLAACKNQSALASVERKSIGITSMSLNTFKVHANDYIDGGFTHINSLRKRLSNKAIPKAKRRRDQLKQSNATLKQQLDEAMRSRAILTKAYTELNTIALDLLANSEGHHYDYERHHQLYREYFGLRLVSENE